MDEQSRERLDALFASFNRTSEPGCAIAVARGGRPIYRRGFGMAAFGPGVAMQPSAAVPAGSIAKQFTCAAILSLAEENKLSFSDRLGDWLPELSPAHSEVTLAQLMRHRSGVRCYLDQWMYSGYRTFQVGSPWATQLRQQALNFPPGSRAAYSNGGYLLLSRIIERASGTSFASFVADRLLRPAGMFASYFGPIGAASAVTLHVRDDAGAWAAATPMTEEAFGDGGLITTADDLLRWALYLRQSTGAASLENLSAPAEPWAIGPSDYRYGLIFQQWRGIRLAHHAGGMPGANSIFLTAPDHDVDIAMLFNRGASPTSLAFQILDILLGDALQPKVAPESAEISALSGRYLGDDDFLFALEDTEGRPALRLFGDGAFPLESWRGDPDALPLWADAGAAQIRFRRGNAPEALGYFDGCAWTPARQIENDTPAASDILFGVEGAFHSADAAARMRFDADAEGLLIAIESGAGVSRYRAEPVAPDLLRFWPPQFPAGKLARIVRDADGRATSIVIRTQRTTGMTFVRDQA